MRLDLGSANLDSTTVQGDDGVGWVNRPCAGGEGRDIDSDFFGAAYITERQG